MIDTPRPGGIGYGKMVWEYIIIGVVILAAVSGAAYAVYRALSGRGGCNCPAKPNCPFKDDPAPPPCRPGGEA